MSRHPVNRFAPPSFSSSAGLSPSTTSSGTATGKEQRLMYDSAEEDSGLFQVIPSPEHQPVGNRQQQQHPQQPQPHTPMRIRNNQVTYHPVHSTPRSHVIHHTDDDEEEMVTPSSSFTGIESSVAHSDLPASSQQQQHRGVSSPTTDDDIMITADDEHKLIKRSSRAPRVTPRHAVRLDLLDADDEDEEQQDDIILRHNNNSHAQHHRTNSGNAHNTNRPEEKSITSPITAIQTNTPAATTSTTASTAGATRFDASSASRSIPVAIPHHSPVRDKSVLVSTEELSLPFSQSFDDYAEFIPVPPRHSKHHHHHHQHGSERSGTSRRDEDEDEEFDGGGDVIELEDDHVEESSPVATPHNSVPGTTTAVTSTATSSLNKSPNALRPAPASPGSAEPRRPSFSLLDSLPMPSTIGIARDGSSTAAGAMSVPPVVGDRVSPGIREITASPDQHVADDEDDHDEEGQAVEDRDEISSQILNLSNDLSSYPVHSHSLSHYTANHPSVQPARTSVPLASASVLPVSPADSAAEDEYNDGNVMVVPDRERRKSLSNKQLSQRAAVEDEEDAELEPLVRLESISSTDGKAHEGAHNTDSSIHRDASATAVSSADGASVSSIGPAILPSPTMYDDDGSTAQAKHRRYKVRQKKAGRIRAKKEKAALTQQRQQQSPTDDVVDDNIIFQPDDRPLPALHPSHLVDEEEEEAAALAIPPPEQDTEEEEDDDDTESIEDSDDEADDSIENEDDPLHESDHLHSQDEPSLLPQRSVANLSSAGSSSSLSSPAKRLTAVSVSSPAPSPASSDHGHAITTRRSRGTNRSSAHSSRSPSPGLSHQQRRRQERTRRGSASSHRLNQMHELKERENQSVVKEEEEQRQIDTTTASTRRHDHTDKTKKHHRAANDHRMNGQPSQASVGDYHLDGDDDGSNQALSNASPVLSRTASGRIRRPRKRSSGSVDTDIQYSDLSFDTKIGEGAFGCVYRGWLWGQEVAIKKISLDGSIDATEQQQIIKDFKKETKIMKHLRHPNVVEYLGACITSHCLCLLTEYLSAGSLEDVLLRLKQQAQTMPDKRVTSLALDIIKGLNWLHHKGIIHRDLKPGNILLTPFGTGKLADFGLAHIKQRQQQTLIGYHGIAGSPSYIAPEVLQHHEYGPAADVYSFGILLNEMCSGDTPYEHTAAAEMELVEFERQVIAGIRPVLASNRPWELLVLIQQCWSAAAQDRPTVQEIMKRLEKIDKQIQQQQTQEQQQQQLAEPLLPQDSHQPLSDSRSLSSLSTALSSSSLSSLASPTAVVPSPSSVSSAPVSAPSAAALLSSLDALPPDVRSMLLQLAEKERVLKQATQQLEHEKVQWREHTIQWEQQQQRKRQNHPVSSATTSNTSPARAPAAPTTEPPAASLVQK